MIRRFIQCKNTKERYEMIASTQMQDWTEGQLDTVMEIVGVKMSEGASMEDKWNMILLALSNKDVTTEREFVKAEKVFQDAGEEVELSEELEKVSDLAAYVKVCKNEEITE